MLRIERLLMTVCWLGAGMAALAQGEALVPLGMRPVAEAARAKANGPRTHFSYSNQPQALPILDDFSIDRTRKRWARPGDPGVALTDTYYRIEAGGISQWNMAFASDTTFLYLTDIDADPPVTTRSPLAAVSIVLRNLDAFPPSAQTIDAWPAYNVFDTIQHPSPDQLPLLAPAYVQDSLLAYAVAPDPRTYVQPDGSLVPLILWEDDDVYVNANYPIDPPSIGVATFDGLARTGYPYDYANYTSYGDADKLTSVPINLLYPASDSIYLSFYYQPQGLSGDNYVQPQDSLVLEFYAPVEQFWYRIWATPYVVLQPFQQVMVPIVQARFLKDGFRMRFRNKATLSGSFDHWHLDYVRLARQRTATDTGLNDVAYLMPESSLLQTYTSVPFKKFQDQPQSYMAPGVTAAIRNHAPADRFITYKMLARESEEASAVSFGNGQNTFGNAASTFTAPFAVGAAPSDFVYDPGLSEGAAFWEVEQVLLTNPDANHYNDTVRFVQEISNYYAYDDGSAEAGYGLNAGGGQLAYRFDMVGGDSLRALRLYFNPIANPPPQLNPASGSFLITVWSSLSPPAIIHQDFTFHSPAYRLDGIDHFVEYPLDSTIWVEGTFYIGWTQTNGVNMNLGFDRNRNNRNKIFYSTSGSFANTSFEGSLMMRPVFVAGTDPFAGIGGASAIADGFALFPNPADQVVRLVGASLERARMVEVHDGTGRLLLRQRCQGNPILDVSEVPPGLAIVRLLDASGTPIAAQRLIIQR
jgi:hypothetical protein